MISLICIDGFSSILHQICIITYIKKNKNKNKNKNKKKKTWALKCYEIWSAYLTDFRDNPRFLHVQYLLEHAVQ